MIHTNVSQGNWWNTENCWDGINVTEDAVKHNDSKSPVEEYWEYVYLKL